MKWLRRTEKTFFLLNVDAQKHYRHGLQVDAIGTFVQRTKQLILKTRGKGMQGGSPYRPLWFVNTANVLSNYEMLTKYRNHSL